MSETDGKCRMCGGVLSENPHPDAGEGKLNEVGDKYECIPCLVRTRHEWCCMAWDYGNRLRGYSLYGIEVKS